MREHHRRADTLAPRPRNGGRVRLGTAIPFAVWAGFWLPSFEPIFGDVPRVWAYVLAFGPPALYWLWHALRD
jgi:hypothetical protein